MKRIALIAELLQISLIAIGAVVATPLVILIGLAVPAFLGVATRFVDRQAARAEEIQAEYAALRGQQA